LQNKKSTIEFTVVLFILAVLSLIIISSSIVLFFSRAEDVTAETTCRGSVAARAKFSIEPPGGKISFSPLLCKTQDKELPKTGETEEDVKKDMAELVKRCWWQFGNGLVDNVFHAWGGGPGSEHYCFVCYTFTIKDKGKTITQTDLNNYLSQTYVKKKQYDKESKEIKDVELYTYTTYVQSSGGAGKIIIDAKEFKTGEQYAIGFVSPHFFFDLGYYEWLSEKLGEEGANIDGYILVDEFTKMGDKCNIVKDISGY